MCLSSNYKRIEIQPQKTPKVYHHSTKFITHVIIPANTGQIKALEAGVRPGFKTWSHRTQICLWLRIKKKEGDKRIYNPNEVCPRYSPLKIEVYKSLLMVQSAILVKNGKWKNLEEFKSTPFWFPFTSLFWLDLKRHQ